MGQVNNARFHRFPSDNFHEFCTQQRQSVWRCKLSEHNFDNFIIRGRFSKKTHKFLENLQLLATSGCRNSAMITDRRKIAAKINLHGMSSFHFYCWNQFKVIPLACVLRTEHIPKRFTVDDRMQITALCDKSVITRRRHELYTYSKCEL